MKIIHVINSLNCGGAENMLFKLIKYSDKEKYYHEIISLLPRGHLSEDFETLQVKTHYLNISKKNIIKSLFIAKKIIKNFDIISTWLYYSDFFGFLITRFTNKKLIWNIRHSNLSKEANKKKSLLLIRTNAFFSRFVDKITYNSEIALENHKKIGYSNRNSIIIPNGFELDKFKYNEQYRKYYRNKYNISEKDKILITVGRWDIQKDYYTLLKALNKLKEKINFKIIICGTGLDYNNKNLMKLIKKYKLDKNIILLGRRNDINKILSVADLYVSSSLGESFSNSIGEAMACGLHVVATDVGNNRELINNCGFIVEPKNEEELSKAIELFFKNKNNLNNPREHIFSHFEIKKIIKHIEGVLYEKNVI